MDCATTATTTKNAAHHSSERRVDVDKADNVARGVQRTPETFFLFLLVDVLLPIIVIEGTPEKDESAQEVQLQAAAQHSQAPDASAQRLSRLVRYGAID
jgi:hypothetical protein